MSRAMDDTGYFVQLRSCCLYYRFKDPRPDEHPKSWDVLELLRTEWDFKLLVYYEDGAKFFAKPLIVPDPKTIIK